MSMTRRAMCDLCDQWFEQELGPALGRPRKRCYSCAPYKDKTAAVRANRDAAAWRPRYGVRCLLCREYFFDNEEAVSHLRSHEGVAA